MHWAEFHHPDLSPKVLRRRASEELLDLVLELGEVVMTGGRSITHGWNYPSESAYRCAVYRLRKQGLVAYRRQGGRNPVLQLTAEGKAGRPESFRPERHWKRKWNKVWYVLVYDVPETERGYRSALRGFLRRMRMGCLQGSVWITSDDIRAEFHDLVKAAALDNFAYLFEARTVLGLDPKSLVRNAWDLDRIRELHADYCRTTGTNLARLRKGDSKPDHLIRLARRDAAAYLRVMRDDPLLPRALYPADYLGFEVLNAHRGLTREIRHRL